MGSIDQVNSSVFPLNSGDNFVGIYSSTTNFTEICISIDTDSKYELNLYFSSDGINLGLTKTFNQTSIPTESQIYNIPPYMRFVKVELVNNDTINQTYLRLQTILKLNQTYSGTSTAPASNVNISSITTTDNLNVNVQNFPATQPISGSVDANITNTLLNVSDDDTHTKLDTVITDLDKFKFSGDNCI